MARGTGPKRSTEKVDKASPADASVVGFIEKIGGSERRLRQRRRNAGGMFDEQIHSKRLSDHREGFGFMARVNREDRIIQDEIELFGIGHRVVHCRR